MQTIADILPIPLSLVESDIDAAAAAFGDAFGRTGFAVVNGHAIAPELVARALKATTDFFALPDEIKRKYQLGNGGARGFTPFGIETAKDANLPDLKEFWHMGRDLPPGHRYRETMPDNVWPAEVGDFQAAITALFTALDHAGNRILRALAHHLRLPVDFFASTVADGNSVLRLLHYPPVSPTATGLRAGAHEDINVITLLLGAEEAGLQLLDRAGVWRDIDAPPGALVCNIGDMLQRLTNHRLPSTTHRVVNPQPERRGMPRYSTPYFLHFAPDYLIQTLPSCVDAAHPDRYPKPITANDYLYERLRAIGLM